MRREERNRVSRSRRSSIRKSVNRLSQLETLEGRELFVGDLGPALPHLGTYTPEPPPVVQAITGQQSPQGAGQQQTNTERDQTSRSTVTDAPLGRGTGMGQNMMNPPPDLHTEITPEAAQVGEALNQIGDFLVDLWEGLTGSQRPYDHAQAQYEMRDESWEEMGRRMMNSDFYESFNHAVRNDVGFESLNPERPSNLLDSALSTIGSFIYNFGAVVDDSLPTGTVGYGWGGQIHLFKYHLNLQFDIHIGHDSDAVDWWNTWTVGMGHTIQSGWDSGGLGIGYDQHITVTNAPNVGTLNRPAFVTVYGAFGAPDDFSLEYIYSPGLGTQQFPEFEGLLVGAGPCEGWGAYADDSVITHLDHTGDTGCRPRPPKRI